MVLPVTKVMRKKVATCKPTATVLDATKVLKKYNTSTVVIINQDKSVVGVFSERDLVNKIVAVGKDPAMTLVTEVMSSPAICAEDTDTDVKLLRMIIEKHVKKIPVVKKGKLVGIVAESDLLKSLAESIMSE